MKFATIARETHLPADNAKQPIAPIGKTMPPIQHPLSREASQPLTSGTKLEISLVLFALVTSFVLAMLPSTRDRARTNGGVPSPITSWISIVLIICSAGLGAGAITLSFTGSVSVDALAAVVFGLAPALVSMPFDAIHYIFIRTFDLPGSVLLLSSDEFRYARVGDSCGSGLTEANLSLLRKGSCNGDTCNATMYVRHLPSRYFNPLYGSVQAYRPPGMNVRDDLLQWRGERIGHTRHVVLLKDYDTGSEVRWWRLISSGVWLMSQPWLVHLDSQAQMLQSLELLADIVAIERLVLHFERESLYRDLKSDTVLKGIMGTPGITCNAILGHLNLREWGCFDDSLVAALKKNNFDWKDNLAKEYGLLFLLLTVKSGIYGGRLLEPEGPTPTLESHDGFPRPALRKKDETIHVPSISSYDAPEGTKLPTTFWRGDEKSGGNISSVPPSGPNTPDGSDSGASMESNDGVSDASASAVVRVRYVMRSIPNSFNPRIRWRGLIRWLHEVKGFKRRCSGDEIIESLVNFQCSGCDIIQGENKEVFKGTTAKRVRFAEGTTSEEKTIVEGKAPQEETAAEETATQKVSKGELEKDSIRQLSEDRKSQRDDSDRLSERSDLKKKESVVSRRTKRLRKQYNAKIKSDLDDELTVLTACSSRECKQDRFSTYSKDMVRKWLLTWSTPEAPPNMAMRNAK